MISVDPIQTQVEFFRNSACSECHAKGLCGVQEGETKVVSVPTDGFNLHNVGDEVTLCLKPTMGLKAVWISYVIPLFVLIAALVVASLCGGSELWCGLSGIIAVAAYYIVIWCLRGRLKNEFVFYIK